jgi:tetratricopeptide (TPR) repeat protein
MAKDINKILKTIEHFGEGTFDELEQIVEGEKSLISAVDKEILSDITEGESSLDLDLDSILGEDLKAIGVQIPEEESKLEEIPEEESKLEQIPEELNLEETVEKPSLEEPVFEETKEEIKEEKKETKKEEKKEEVEEEIGGLEGIEFEGLEGLQGLEEPLAFEKQPVEEKIVEEKATKEKTKAKTKIPEKEEEPSELPSAEEFDFSGFGEGPEAFSEEFEQPAAAEFGELPLEETTKTEEAEKEFEATEFEETPIEEKEKPEEENVEIPEEFIDLSLAASGMPIETGMEHEKPHADYSNIEISDEDIHIIINTLKNYPPWLSNEIKNLILNDALSPNELEGLIDLLSNNVHWKAVMEYLKNTLNIDLSYHLTPEEKVYIPTLTEKLLPYIKWISAITILSIVLFVIIFQFFIIPNQAQNYYKIAINVLEKENNVEVAMQNFNRAASMRKFEKYYLIFGRLLLERNYLDQAEQIALRGKNVWPYSLSFYELLSDIYLARGGDKNKSRAFNVLEDLLADKKFVNIPDTYIAIAKRYEMFEEYQEAINIYSEGLRHFQPDFNYYVRMLNDFVILKNYNAASDLYSKIDKRFKKMVDPVVFTKYSEFLLDVNQPFEAKDVFDKIIKYNPNFAPVYLPYAHYFEKMNQPDVALQGLLRAEKIINLGLYKETDEKVFDKILNEIGELYYDKNDDTMAYTYFEKAISENPSFAKAYYNIGRLNYFFYNRYQQALSNFNMAQSLGFSNDYQKYMVGWIQYHLKNYEEALFSFLQLEIEHLSNIDLKLAIGNSHINFGKPELAIGYLANYVSYWENMERQLRNREIKNPKRQEALIKLAVGYNNLGVAYALLAKEKKNPYYESEALRLFIKSQEIYNYIYPGRVSNAESYINAMYILHPQVKRSLLLMDNENYFPKMIF